MKMLIPSLTAIALAVPVGTISISHAQGNPVNVIAKASTVLVQGQNPGSGVLIGKENDTYYMLTAKHVVETDDEYQVVTADGQGHSLASGNIQRLPNLDLALVSFDSSNDYSTAPLDPSTTLNEGDRIFVAGWPIAGSAIPHIYQMTSGEISGIAPRPLKGGYNIIYTNVTRQGMSGGPIFNMQGKLIGIHGQAEGREVYLADADNARVKAGFNLGIPIQAFLNAKSSPRVKPSQAINPTIPQSPVQTSSLPSSASVPEQNPPVSALPEAGSATEPIKPQPIRTAITNTPAKSFIQLPTLLKATPSEATTNHLGARYFFTFESPTGAGADLEQIDFQLQQGVNYPRFSSRGTRAYLGKKRKKSAELPIKMVVSDPKSRTVTLTFAQPIPPGTVFTVALKTIKNPSQGTYLYETRGHTPNSQTRGQYLGLGRIEIRSRVKIK